MILTGVVLALVAVAVFFTFIGALGLLRFPDVYTRAHAATKADTLGAGFGIGAVAIYFGPSVEALKGLFLLAFIYVTNPTAAHAITRAAISQDVPVDARPRGDADGGDNQ